jgi:hypothetical protein
LERRISENKLKRIAVEADHQQDAKVKRWLKLADEVLGRSDDDQNPSAA